MRNRLLLLAFVAMLCLCSYAQSSRISLPNKMNGAPVNDEFIIDINSMSQEKRYKLDDMASRYRANSRSVLSNLGKSMLIGGAASLVNVVTTELFNLTKVRKNQKMKWQAMRNKECLFVDSLQSINGQRDFYRMPSSYGPLDPSDMNFDGITFRARRAGKDVLRVVCHLDTTRLSHLFLHSKFYLVLDTLEFHPYQSFLPNLTANRVMGPDEKASEDEIEYWNTIRQFDFAEQQNPTINIRMNLSSSWINEAVQVYQDIPLGGFIINIPVSEDMLKDSVYFYSREKVMAEGGNPINVSGDCFVIPRSYMPVSATNPSWGTGEYKLKVVMTETCRYNPSGNRAKNWHEDYKQLVRMQNKGKSNNEYLTTMTSAVMDNSSTILKATYSPLVTFGMTALGLQSSNGAGGMNAASMAAAKAAAAQGAAGAGASGQKQSANPAGPAK